MKSYQNTTRRDFISKSAFGLGAAGLFGPMHAGMSATGQRNDRLPREVWVATITQYYLKGDTIPEVIGNTLKTMESVVCYRPDIICLPEVFHVAGLEKNVPVSSETSEVPIGHLTQPIADFAKKNHCYVIAPVYTSEKGNHYISAVLIDRQGRLAGVYHKARPTAGEMNDTGISPGLPDPPVFDTDFGKIGIQICFDIEWPEGWQKLKEKGAELVFWSSAFGGGRKVNNMAWANKYPVISSTRKGASRICDSTGESIAESGLYSRWGVCAPLNLEKAIIHSWPYAHRFQEIHAKYGDRVRTYSLHEEEISILESRSPDIKVADVMREFDIISYEENKRRSEAEQNKRWTSAQ
jgi:predicted amidohydrolase